MVVTYYYRVPESHGITKTEGCYCQWKRPYIGQEEYSASISGNQEPSVELKRGPYCLITVHCKYYEGRCTEPFSRIIYPAALAAWP